MNEIELLSFLNSLPAGRRTANWIKGELRHEQLAGVHTYHSCTCGRGLCRSDRCAQCWQQLLGYLTGDN